MKKLLLTALCFASIHSVYAGTCEKVNIDFKGTQTYSDDEFLYEKEKDFEVFGDGYECDNDFCEDGTTITMWPGHYYKGKQIDETVTYKCSTGLTGDKWEPVSNGNSGDVVSTRWCDGDTKVGAEKYLDVEIDAEIFEKNKDVWESAYVDNVYAAAVGVTCEDNGWKFEKVYRCFAPYVANVEGLCEHYTTFLTNNLESYYGWSYDKHREILGMPESEYEQYRSGEMDKGLAIDIMMSDPAVSDRSRR